MEEWGGGGPGLSAEVNVKATHHLSFNLTFDSTLDRIGGLQHLNDPIISFSLFRGNLTFRRSRELTDRTRLLVGGPNLRYRVLSSGQAALDFSTGFDVLSLQFRSMVKTFESLSSTTFLFSDWAGTTTTRREEKYFGYGPRFGLSASFKPTERLAFSAEGFYTTFLDLSGSKERTGGRNFFSFSSGGANLPSEGHAFRFDLGAYYELRQGLSLGAGYRGYLLSIDQSKTKNVSGSDVNIGAEDIRTDLFYGYLGVDF